MIVYVKDRSGKAPRKPKRKRVVINSAPMYNPPPYRAPDHSNIPSAMNELFKLGLEKEQRVSSPRYIYNKASSS